jgi:hypothetical protein
LWRTRQSLPLDCGPQTCVTGIMELEASILEIHEF